ncbi:MAG: oligoribonuclease [Candidatus Dojkabacteria bacterium]|nr:MAG: oligoribonuclease [Candidatus Dojkabacteria bacterium]
MKKRSSHNLIWIDLELTGLDIKKDKILEIACVVTDRDLNYLTEVVNYVIHYPKSILKQMDPWSLEVHTKSGLIDEVLNSKTTLLNAQKQILEIIIPFTKPGQNLLAGSSVHFDKMFLAKFMPELDNYLKWQIIDVATVRNLAYRWYKIKPFPKKDSHRAKTDIIESIQELKYLKELIFK